MAPKIWLVVHIEYSPTRFRSLLVMDFPTRYDHFRWDLSQLKLPHPPAKNFKMKLDREILMCFWETKRYSVRVMFLSYSILIRLYP